MPAITDYIDQFQHSMKEFPCASEELKALAQELCSVLRDPGVMNGSALKTKLQAFEIETDDDRKAVSFVIKFLHDNRDGYVEAYASQSWLCRNMAWKVTEVFNNNIGIGTEKLKAYREIVTAEHNEADELESVDDLLDSFPETSSRLIELLTEKKRVEVKFMSIREKLKEVNQLIKGIEQEIFYDSMGLNIISHSYLGQLSRYLPFFSLSKEAEEDSLDEQLTRQQKRQRIFQLAVKHLNGKIITLSKEIDEQALIDKSLRLLDFYGELRHEESSGKREDSKFSFFKDKQAESLALLRSLILSFGEDREDEEIKQLLIQEIKGVKKQFCKSVFGEKNKHLLELLEIIEEDLGLVRLREDNKLKSRASLLSDFFFSRKRPSKRRSMTDPVVLMKEEEKLTIAP